MKSGWRLGAVGLVFTVMFGILTLQLWRVQVVESAELIERAAASQVKVVYTPAPRGQILDIGGRQLAGTTATLAAVVDGALVPEDAVDGLVSLLAAFTQLPAAEVAEIVNDARDRGDRRIVITELEERDAVYLAEHREEFVGVSVVRVPQRTYPYKNVASGVLGYIGQPDTGDIEAGASPTDILGKAGLEKTYDAELQGEQGTIKFRVDARRKVLDVLGEAFPEPGNTLILNLDIELQVVLEQALVDGLDLARTQYNDNGCEPGDDDKGCPVRAVGLVQNVKDGSVLAMASVPNFDPGVREEWNSLPDGALTNFAVTGQYAPASTFKALTYVMAMEENVAPSDVRSVEDEILCSGQLAKPLGDGSQQVFRNWTRTDDGLQDIHTALMRSCNTYFWEIAYALWDQYKGTEDEDLLQQWARKVGFDEKTEIDLPFERPGIIPDRDLFQRWAASGDPRLDPSRLEYGSPWFGGDLLNAAVGQGTVLATPVQLATAYAALVNGGTVWQPRVVHEIRSEDGLLVERHEPEAIRVIEELDASTVRALRNDLQSVVNNPRGTAYAAFADFGPLVNEVGGKTGTAEVIKTLFEDGVVVRDSVTTALFVGVAPVSDPEYVVVVIIERGGSGGGIAAPTAKPVLQHLLDQPITKVSAGQDAD